MVIVSFGCGLGNQMFQYAFYHKLEILYPMQHILCDKTYSFEQEHNGYELDKVFGITIPECSKKDAYRLSMSYSWDNSSFPYILYIKARNKLGWNKKTYFYQTDRTEFYDSYLKINEESSYYFKGVFANYRYFEGVENDLIDRFKFPRIDDQENILLEKEIINNNSVSIHLRRGDYIDLGIATPSMDYYSSAIQIMRNRVGNDISFFIFSDDPKYAHGFFSFIDNKTIVDHNFGENSYIDMYLMSLCKHNIITNSSFSFWGAFLNSNKDKIVISTKIPFGKCKNPFYYKGWINL